MKKLFICGLCLFTFTGLLYAPKSERGGDNLGNHEATQELNMNNYRILNTSVPYADTSGSGGGTTIETSTGTILIKSTGDIYSSTSTFQGSEITWVNNFQSTPTLTSVQIYVITFSTVGSSYFKVAYSSTTGNPRVWSYVTNTIEISTNSNLSPVTTLNQQILPNASISVHTTGIPASGLLPSGENAIFTYWKKWGMP